jgi:hypothetical protein
MDRVREAVDELAKVFRASSSKHAANRTAARILEQLTRQPAFLTAVLANYLAMPRTLDRRNYPVVAIPIATTPWFGLVANCWIPLPGRETTISTKAIHHHGNMLLTTATLFGPGYEHWMFSTPKLVDAESGLYSMDLLEVAPHPQHHVSFVDAWIAHTPFYPRELSITLALWSNRFDTTWRDHVKRLPGVSANANVLRKAALKFGLRKALDLKVIESFDFFPTGAGFANMRDRKEFDLGPTDDHLHSVFHVIQRTGNEHLGRVVRGQLERGAVNDAARPTVERLLSDLNRGVAIEGRLSSNHYGLQYANFSRDDVFGALRALGKKVDHGGKLAPTQGHQETHRSGAQ